MYEMPVLFPAISNRESWVLTIQLSDDQTGDPIMLTDGAGTALYALYLEISAPRHYHGGYGGQYSSPYYDERGGHGRIFATLADYLSIIDVGTIQVQIPYTVMQTLRGGLTYDVYMRIVGASGDFVAPDFVAPDFTIADETDARQLLIGKLPVHFGGHGP